MGLGLGLGLGLGSEDAQQLLHVVLREGLRLVPAEGLAHLVRVRVRVRARVKVRATLTLTESLAHRGGLDRLHARQPVLPWPPGRLQPG